MRGILCVFFVAMVIYGFGGYCFSFDMISNSLVIDFSPSTTNLVYDLVNATIDTSNRFLRLGGGYSYFKITNIRLDKSRGEFFRNLFINLDLAPSTSVEGYIMDGRRRVVLYQFYLTSTVRSYFLDLYEVLPKSTDEVYFVFVSQAPSWEGGRIFVIVLTKEVIVEGDVGDNEVKIFPNPVMVVSGDFPKIVVNLSKDSNLTIVVFDSAGNLIKSIVNEKVLERGIHLFSWDLKDEKGKDVPSGKYIIFSKINNSSSAASLLVIR